ncbi:MAG: hypothetical protein ACREU8_10240, partial [Gammaproteobacteria bacterium]
MSARILESPREPTRSRCPDRAPIRFLIVALGIIGALGPGSTRSAKAGPPITIINALPPSPVCPGGNTVSVFTSGQQVIQPGGPLVTITGDFSKFPGFGLQVNNWYWTSISLPVQKGGPQNPDNSGAQFALSDQCDLSKAPAWFG